jgi:hypothetical protein
MRLAVSALRMATNRDFECNLEKMKLMRRGLLSEASIREKLPPERGD